MGGCASRPKDMDINERAPAEAPAVDNEAESTPVAQENNGGEATKTEESSLDIPEPTEAAKESSESTPVEEPAEVAESKSEEKIEADAALAEAAPVEAAPADVASAEAAPAEAEVEKDPAEVNVGSKTEKTPEPVEEEAKIVEAQISEDKSDAPLVTM